jgi:hypothetical protein
MTCWLHVLLILGELPPLLCLLLEQSQPPGPKQAV